MSRSGPQASYAALGILDDVVLIEFAYPALSSSEWPRHNVSSNGSRYPSHVLPQGVVGKSLVVASTRLMDLVFDIESGRRRRIVVRVLLERTGTIEPRGFTEVAPFFS